MFYYGVFEVNIKKFNSCGDNYFAGAGGGAGGYTGGKQRGGGGGRNQRHQPY